MENKVTDIKFFIMKEVFLYNVLLKMLSVIC